MPISCSASTPHREQTRQTLFHALSSLMTIKGFDAITMADIAAEAGIGRTAIYNYFSDKETLLLAFVDAEMNKYLSRMETELQKYQHPLDRLCVYAHMQLLTERSYLISPGAPLKEVLTPETGHALHKHVEVTGSILAHILHECIENDDIPPQDIAVTVQLIHGALTGRHIPRSEPDRTEFLTKTETFILRAVGAKHRPLSTIKIDTPPTPTCHRAQATCP